MMILRYFTNKKIARKVYELNNKVLFNIQNIFKNIGLDTDVTGIRSIDIFGEFLDQSMYITDFDIFNDDENILWNQIRQISKDNHYDEKFITLPIPKRILEKELFDIYWLASSFKYHLIAPYQVKVSYTDIIFIYLGSLNSHTTTSNTKVRDYILKNSLDITIHEKSFEPISTYLLQYINSEINNKELSNILNQIRHISEYLFKFKHLHKVQILNILQDILKKDNEIYIDDLISFIDMEPLMSEQFQILLVEEYITSLIADKKYSLTKQLYKLFIGRINFKSLNGLRYIENDDFFKKLSSNKAIELLSNTQVIYNRFINELSKIEYFQNKKQVDKILKNKQLFISIE
jgi:hypothetical protein